MATHPPLTGTIDEHLWGFLDHTREVFARKTGGLDVVQLDQRLEPSTMTLGGMISHLAYVEDYWFSHRFAGNPPHELWAEVDWEADNDFDWHRAPGLTGEQLQGEWREAVERSRACVAGASWETVGQLPGRSGHRPDLGWIVVHMIDEYARHNGHADLIRESIDGATG